MRIQYTFILACFCGFLLSCEREVTLDIEQEPPRLVIYAILNPDSLITVWVSQTKSVLDVGRTRAVHNATVTVTPEGQSPQSLMLYNTELGQYSANFKPQIGMVYNLTVTADGFPPVEATTRVPIPVPIQQFSYNIQGTNEVPWCVGLPYCDSIITEYAVLLTWHDPTPDENFYEVFNTMDYLTEYSVYDSIRKVEVFRQDTATYEPNQVSNDLIVSEPGEANNLQAYNVSEAFRFSDQLFDGRSYTFRYILYSDRTRPLTLKAVLRTYHPELYRYEQGKQNQQGEDFLLAYEPVQIPQNIRGGYGIFSSYSQDTVVIELP